jgi:REP element-mobilizing transposase RayT
MEGMRISAIAPHSRCMTYLITWCCYGSHIPGEEGIVSKRNNHFGTRVAAPSIFFAHASRAAMTDEPFELDHAQRQIVLKAIVDVGQRRDWTVLAVHVRTEHVHVVVDAGVPPERIMHDLKSYARRALNCAQRKWARHGSTRFLYTAEAVANAVRYVVEKQGEPMAVSAYPQMEPRQ